MSNARAALAAKSGSRGKIHDRCCQGLRASWTSQRRTVDAETASTMPRATASTASSGALHRDSGTPVSAGSSQASALTVTTATGGKARGRPVRGRSFNPARPSSKNRLRHLDTSCTATSSRSAITVFSSPSAASSTIFARITWWYGAV